MGEGKSVSAKAQKQENLDLWGTGFEYRRVSEKVFLLAQIEKVEREEDKKDIESLWVR